MSGPLNISFKDELLFIKSILIPAFDPDNELDTSKKRKDWMRQEAIRTNWDAGVSEELIKRYGTVKSLDEATAERTKAMRLLGLAGSMAAAPAGAEHCAASSFEAMNMYAQLLGAEEDDVCLSIDAGAVFPLTSFEKDHKPGQNKVLARTCTRQLFEIFVWIVQGNKFEGKTRKGVIITGPPGDGKSFASQYFLAQFIKQKTRHVVYENVQGKRVWVFRQDGVCRAFAGPATSGKCPELQDQETIYIFDSSAAFGTSYEPLLCRAWLAFFSSANDMATKQTARGEFLELGFVTPSLDELRVAYEVLLNDPNSVDPDKQWDLFGGKLRWAFDKTQQEVHRALNKAVNKFDIDKIDAIMHGHLGSTIGHPDGVPTSLFSTFLDPQLQVELSRWEALPRSPEHDTKRMEALIMLYCAENLKWVLSGDMVFDKIVNKYNNITLDIVLEKLYQATVNTSFSGLVGHSLQSNAAKLLAAGGVFSMRELVPPHSGDSAQIKMLTVPARHLVPLDVNVAKNIKHLLLNYADSSALYNICGNFKGVNSITPPNLSFQYTSGGGHCADLETTAEMNELALAADNKKPLIQAFVVPKEMFDVWLSQQPYQFHSISVTIEIDGQRVWKGCFQGSVLIPNEQHDVMNAASGLAVNVDHGLGVSVSLGENVVKVTKNTIDIATKKNNAVAIELGGKMYSMTHHRITESLQYSALCKAQQKRLCGVKQVVIGVPYSQWELPSDAVRRMGLAGHTRGMSTLVAGRTSVGCNGLSVMRTVGGIVRRLLR